MSSEKEQKCNVEHERIPEEFEGLIDFLTFFRKYGKLHLIDIFANTYDEKSVINIINELESLVARLPRAGNLCVDEEVREDEVSWYQWLGAKVEKGRLKIPCPRPIPRNEIQKLIICMKEGKIMPRDIVAFVYAR